MWNKCEFIGRLGKDPEARTIENGSMVVNFSLATSESWKDKTTGEKKEKTEWVNCVAWDPLSKVVAQYVHKGDLLFISGKMQTRSWEKDGVTRYTTEILVKELKMLGGKKDSETDSLPKAAVSTNTPNALDDIEDRLPF